MQSSERILIKNSFLSVLSVSAVSSIKICASRENFYVA
jgi:hypothetical protein